VFFFFQAEDGIRDFHVTGVQTCALPICVCREIPEAACVEQPRSFLLQLVSLTLTRLGDALVSPRLVLAWMLSALGAPAFFVGFLVPLRESLALLPQLLVAQFMRERAVRKG